MILDDADANGILSYQVLFNHDLKWNFNQNRRVSGF